jgi:hypothetical protein
MLIAMLHVCIVNTPSPLKIYKGLATALTPYRYPFEVRAVASPVKGLGRGSSRYICVFHIHDDLAPLDIYTVWV